MSEYQYYEFRALDRTLNTKEMGVLRSISSRAEITSTSFINTYNWGDLKADPDKLIEKYFDAFLYVANWGTRRFVIRLPRTAIDSRSVSPYGTSENLRVRRNSDLVIVEFLADLDDPEWEEGEGWMASLLPLRAELLRGDLRCLYLGWLRGVQEGDFEDAEKEPEVPAGLGSLSAPLDALADFLDLDKHLIEVAAETSERVPPPPADADLAEWLGKLPEAGKDDLLIRAATGRSADIGAEVLRRFHQEREGSANPAAPRRTVGELLAGAQARAEEAAQQAAKKRATEESKQKREQDAARARHLVQLAGREPALWKKVQALVQTKRPNDYDRAVTILIDLRDLADRVGQGDQFQSALAQVRADHQSKPSFLRRLAAAKL
jgi:hypothetical protein